jgi:hypothetical protein
MLLRLPIQTTQLQSINGQLPPLRAKRKLRLRLPILENEKIDWAQDRSGGLSTLETDQGDRNLHSAFNIPQNTSGVGILEAIEAAREQANRFNGVDREDDGFFNDLGSDAGTSGQRWRTRTRKAEPLRSRTDGQGSCQSPFEFGRQVSLVLSRCAL